MPARFFASAGLSALAGLWAPADPSMPAGFVPFSHIDLLVVQDMIKSFFIKKPVIATDNTIAQIYIKGAI